MTVWNTALTIHLSGQRSQDPTNLLQGQGLQEAHPAQGHPSVALYNLRLVPILKIGRVQGRKGFAVRAG
jgi:hypothetical protein